MLFGLYQPQQISPAPVPVPFVEVAHAAAVHSWTTEELKELARSEAEKNGLVISHFVQTIAHESGGWQNIQSGYPDKNGPNGKEDSWGVCQIHLPDHLEISREQALDPAFCIPWMAQEWVAGRASRWSSYTMYQRIGWPVK